MADLLEGLELESGDVLAATKLNPPRARGGLIERRELVDELIGGTHRRLTLIDAPAGYGKTTLLGEWRTSTRETRPFAWLSIDEEDNDPVRFWSGVVLAIRTVEPQFGDAVLGALRSRNVALVDVALPLLVNELADFEQSLVLVLDDYHLIDEERVHDSLSFFLDRLPPTLQLAMATRVEPPLPLGRLRVRDELTEIRADRLRLDGHEAAALLQGALGLRLDSADVARLWQRTEGWAAALYLAALSLRGRPDRDRFIESFAGDDRHVVDYLSAEVLAGQPEELREFLLRTAVLERLSAPLCDEVTDRTDSAETLERLERRNLFLIPLDSTRTWYRYHHLFRELLRHELRLTEPELVPELQRRAYEWHRDQGNVAEAIHHATAAGELDAARELIEAHWSDFFNRGRLETVGRWLAGLPREHLLSEPGTCVACAWLALDRGRLEEASDWIEAAERALTEDDDASSRAAVGVLRAVHGFKSGGLRGARRAAERVLAMEESEDPFSHTVAGLILGVTLYWQGQLGEARAALREAAALAKSDGNDLGRGYSLGYLGLIAADEGDLDEAERLGRAATGLSEDPGFTEHFVLMAGHLARARAAEGKARLEEAERLSERAAELSDRGAGRIELAATLIALARLRQLRGDREAGRDLVKRAHRVLDPCPDPGRIADERASAERALSATKGPAPTPGEELTDRELAVLRMLASTLSRREIADSLFVSANTVKTHMRSIYRKLEASTREEALARAREQDLL